MDTCDATTLPVLSSSLETLEHQITELAAGEAMYVRRRDWDAANRVARENSPEFFRDTDIETLNREHDLDIDANTCVSLWDGTRMDHAMAVQALLYRDGALQLDPATGLYPAHFPRVQQDE